MTQSLYETVCVRMGYDEWSNLKERIVEPEVQECIQTFFHAFDEYATIWENYKTTQVIEHEERCHYAEWFGHVALSKLLIRVDGPAGLLHKPFDEPYAEWLHKKKYEEKISNIIPLEKELPDDVLAIIRQYSKPAFVYFREYNEALRIFKIPVYYKQKLKEKIGDPAVREQIKICVDANDDYVKMNAIYLADKTHENEYTKNKSNWWASVSREKFVALLDDLEYSVQGYAEWYFQDEIDNAWRDSDDDPPLTEEEWNNEWEISQNDLSDEEGEESKEGEHEVVNEE